MALRARDAKEKPLSLSLGQTTIPPHDVFHTATRHFGDVKKNLASVSLRFFFLFMEQRETHFQLSELAK